MIKKIDKKNKFVSMFNPNTGFYMRSGVIENGKDTGVDPFMTSFPELLDIGVMGHCVHGASGLCMKSGVQCYQNGLKTKYPNMGFYLLTGIARETLNAWRNGENKLSSKSSDIAKKLYDFREESLSAKLATANKNPVGILAILNRHYSWNLPGVSRESANKTALTAAELPQLNCIESKDNLNNSE